MFYSGHIITKSINEMIRMINAIREKEQYFREKFLNNYNMIDMQARENIAEIRKLVLAYKCYYRLNHYSKKDREMNNNAKSEECIHYSQVKIWEHVVQYSKIMHIRIEFIVKMYKELKAK